MGAEVAPRSRRGRAEVAIAASSSADFALASDTGGRARTVTSDGGAFLLQLGQPLAAAALATRPAYLA